MVSEIFDNIMDPVHEEEAAQASAAELTRVAVGEEGEEVAAKIRRRRPSRDFFEYAQSLLQGGGGSTGGSTNWGEDPLEEGRQTGLSSLGNDSISFQQQHLLWHGRRVPGQRPRPTSAMVGSSSSSSGPSRFFPRPDGSGVSQTGAGTQGAVSPVSSEMAAAETLQTLRRQL